MNLNSDSAKEDNSNEKPMNIDNHINNVENENEILNPNNIIKEEQLNEESNKIEINDIFKIKFSVKELESKFKNNLIENNVIKTITINKNWNSISSVEKKTEENIECERLNTINIKKIEFKNVQIKSEGNENSNPFDLFPLKKTEIKFKNDLIDNNGIKTKIPTQKSNSISTSKKKLCEEEEVNEDKSDEKFMNVDSNINSVENENEILNPNNIIKEEQLNEESNKIEINDISITSFSIKKIELNEKMMESDSIKALIFDQNQEPISSVTKKSEENIKVIGSSTPKKIIDCLAQGQKEISEITINIDEFISPEKQEEIKDEKEIVIKKKEYTNFKENEKKYVNDNKQKIKSAKSKSQFYKPSLIRKEDLFNFNFDKAKANKSHDRINVNFNLENLHEMYNKISIIENKEVVGDNIILQDIETTKSNFINQFQKFLEQKNIEIINNFPVSTDEKNIYIFQQSYFWYLVITYLFYKNSDITPYNIFYLLDLFNKWSKDKNIEIFNSIKERIKNYFISNYSKEFLSKFLFINKLENIDQIFAKYKLLNENTFNNNNIYVEIKVDAINYFYDIKREQYDCDLCKSDEACIKKVCDLNKTRMEIVNNSSTEYFKKEITSEDIIKKNNNCIMFNNNEELFHKGKSKKKTNTNFSKSKTIFKNESFLEYIPKQPTTLPLSLTEETIENVTKKNENIIENIEKEQNEEIIDNNIDITEQEKKASSPEDSPKKIFKNISKSERKPKYEEENNIAIMSEEKEPLELKDEEENSKDERKNIKKEKKSQKGKRRKKKNNNSKKKKDSITKERNATEKEENANEEQHEEEKTDKSVKKKKKSTYRSSLKKNKNKICAKDENIENVEIAKFEEIDLGTRIAHKFVEDTSVNNSKKKKSKTPNKKKSRKH